jgi:tetratricopeptide (TPR) repeat protein
VNWTALIAAASLAAIAAAGILRPFGRPGAPRLERIGGPLEEERAGLFRALRRLDDERAAGLMNEEDYLALRRETQARAVAVLRALEAGGDSRALSEGLREMRRPTMADRNGRGAARRRSAIPVAIAGLLIACVVGLLLAGATSARDPQQPITGGAGSPAPVGSVAFFEQRVAQHPKDLGARLDLAQRYLDAGDVRASIEQYVVALQLNRHSAEALAKLGYLSYLAGRPAYGLRLADRALDVDDRYPEALYVKGLILDKALDRPDDGARFLRTYLEAAPYGSHATEVRDLLNDPASSAGR